MIRLFFLSVLLFLSTSIGRSQHNHSDDSKTISTIEKVPIPESTITSPDIEELKYPTRHKPHGRTEYPYGHSDVKVQAVPLKISMVKLEGGEKIMSLSAGDTQRWIIQKAFARKSGQTIPVIELKPIQHDISTNMIITTNRRIYHLKLESLPEGSTDSFDRQTSFYYPKDTNFETVGNKPDIERSETKTIKNKSVNTDYSVQKGKHGFPWEPESVWDDGAHTYIKIPDNVSSQVYPVFYGVNDVGERHVINTTFNPKTNILTTDRVIKKGVFTLREKKKGFLGLGTKHVDQELFIIRN